MPDVLLARARTTGITQESLNIDGVRFEIFDVGGQRNERRKWIHAFDNVTSLIFVAAISEYDQVLYEDEAVNRLTEALAVFQQAVNNSCFHSMPVILFLNKFDIFRDKIAYQSKDPSQCEPALWGDYAGGSGSDEAAERAALYFEDKFQAANFNEERSVYVYRTTATDTDLVHKVFDVCKEIILKQNLRGSGFM